MSDGELQEGSVWEAALIVGALKLKNIMLFRLLFLVFFFCVCVFSNYEIDYSILYVNCFNLY